MLEQAVALAALAAMLAVCSVGHADITLADHGVCRAQIVAPAEPSSLETKAAEELSRYIGRIGGVKVAVVSEPGTQAGPRILVGRTRRGREIVPDAKAKKQSPEGFVLRSRGDDIAIVGGGDYGTLYGAYELLEKYLGVRWYLPDPLGEIVPSRDVVTIPDLDDAQRPAFEMRWVGRDDEWNLRNKMNRVDDSAWPAAYRVEPGIYHTQHALVPPSRYFADHPEYFALIDGKRSDNPLAKLCYANRDLPRVIAHNLAALKRKDPSIAFLSFSPTDGQMWCECDDCRALDDKAPAAPDQRYSRRSLVFYNRIAEELDRLIPGQQLLVGAYNVYNQPPKDALLKAHPNLAIVITHYDDYCMAHPVNDPACPPNSRYRRLVAAWQSFIRDIYFYEYYLKVNWADLPWPIAHSIASDIPYFRDIGVRGLHTQCTLSSIWTNFLNYYVAAKLLWNPDADVPALLEDLYRKFYGSAAAPMKAYYETMEMAMAKSEKHFPGNAFHNAKHVFTPETLAAMRRHLDEAHRLADDERVKARLAKCEVSYEYAKRFTDYQRFVDSLRDARSPEELRSGIQRARAMTQELFADLRDNANRYRGIIGRSLLRQNYQRTFTQPLDNYALPARQRARELGLVRQWMIIGPFDNTDMQGHNRRYPPEKELDLSATYEGKADPVSWRLYANPFWDGYIDLQRSVEPNEWACAYALCYVKAPARTPAQLRVGSNDSIIVYLGGRKVLDRPGMRSARLDEDVVDITLPAGTTPILAKVCNAGFDWGFYLRFTDRTGQPLPNLRISPRPQ
jgi:hypothetical protein